MLDPAEWGAILSAPDAEGGSAYRYMLWRILDVTLPLLVVIMLNPSTATHDATDRTVDGLMRRAARMGYGGVLVVNCFSYRAREPGDMKKATDPIGPLNDDAIEMALHEELDLLCAWGANATHRQREEQVKCAITRGRCRPHYLRLCASGAPEHPLYIPSDLGLKPWHVRCQDA